MFTGGKAIIVTGMTGAGKSEFIKQLTANIHDSRLLVYDVQREYFPDDPLPDIETFALKVKGRNNIVAVFEEATIFFNTRGSNKTLRDVLVSKRHNNNIIILAFHSIRAIPYYIYDLVNYVVLFKTNDNRELVEGRHPLLLKAYDKVVKQNKPFHYEVIKL